MLAKCHNTDPYWTINEALKEADRIQDSSLLQRLKEQKMMDEELGKLRQRKMSEYMDKVSKK